MKKNRLFTIVMASLCMVLCLNLSGCGEDAADSGGDSAGTGDPAMTEPVSRDFFAMDTYMTVTAYGEKAAEATEAAEAEVNRLDAMLSTGNKDSEIAGVNAGGESGAAGGGELSEEAGALVEKGLALYEETGKKFDIAIYPVMEAWGFTDKDYRVPDQAELEDLLPLTDASKVHYDAEKHRISFEEEGMAIDLGGIAKGYTSSRIMEIYREHGIESGLVSLGGNVQVLGTKPDGSPWRVAVQDPGKAEAEDSSGGGEGGENGEGGEGGEVQYLGVFEAEDVAVITSGAYERNFTQDGRLYHHIIDPATGKPADSGLKSVTIVSEDGTLADALSTSLYIMGKDEALDYWRAHKDEFNCILMDDAGELYVTEPIADKFSSDTYHITLVD